MTNKELNPTPTTLSMHQQEALTGLLLGDGCIQFSRQGAKNARITCVRQAKDFDYMLWHYNKFPGFYLTSPKIRSTFDNRTQKTYLSCNCISRCSAILSEYRELWYKNGKKKVPRSITLTPLTLLIWFLDDGCIVKSSKNGLTLKMSTDGFCKSDVYFLAKLLGNYIGEHINVYMNGSNYILKGSSYVALKIIDIIDPILPDCMERKRTWRDVDLNYIKTSNNFGGRKLNKY